MVKTINFLITDYDGCTTSRVVVTFAELSMLWLSQRQATDAEWTNYAEIVAAREGPKEDFIWLYLKFN